MTFTIWSLIIGVVFIAMALAGTVLKRLPLTSAIFYWLVGLVLGPLALGFLQIDPLNSAALLERVTEVAILISLFATGLRLRTPLSNGRWILPVRLAVGSMLITVGLITLLGVGLLELPLGAALLLGGMLAPTDPVLASDVQVEHPWDQDRLRFSLTGEAALNDGSSTPFVLLGLGLLGLHPLGEFGWRWALVDVVWGVAGGLALGWLAGTLVGRLVLYLRSCYKEATGLDDFLSLGLIGLTYGLANLCHVLSFLAVLAAGLAWRRIERESSGQRNQAEVEALLRESDEEELATHPEKAPAYMVEKALGFNEQLERIAEVFVVLLIGGLLAWRYFRPEIIWFVPVLFLVIRPLSVWLALLGSHTTRLQRNLISWFGVRGVASIYYLCYAVEQGLAPGLAQELAGLALATTSVSIIAHGISVTPLMSFYARRKKRYQERQARLDGPGPTQNAA